MFAFILPGTTLNSMADGKREDPYENWEDQWDAYAREMQGEFDPDSFPILSDDDGDHDAAPISSRLTGPRDWEEVPEDPEVLRADVHDTMNATYGAAGKRPMTGVEKGLLGVALAGLVLILLNEVSVIDLSSTMFMLVLVASAGAAVAWVISFATASRKEWDDGATL